MRMCVLPQERTNSVGHITTAMSEIQKVLYLRKRNLILTISRKKGVLYAQRDQTEIEGSRKFVLDHISDGCP